MSYTCTIRVCVRRTQYVAWFQSKACAEAKATFNYYIVLTYIVLAIMLILVVLKEGVISKAVHYLEISQQ